jgi:hypothetical protein
LKVQAAPADLTIDIASDTPAQMQADIAVDIPQLFLYRADKVLGIRNQRLTGEIGISQDAAAVSVSELVLDYPSMRLSGRFTAPYDRSELRVQLEGRKIDVAATRRAALELAGQSELVRDIFEVLRGGTVPRILVTAQGQELRDLGDPDALVIQGQMRGGDIFIPGVELDLTDTDGDVVISRGILEGDNLRARLGNSSGHNGRMTLGLAGQDPPFRLNIDVMADLSQLPPILERLTDNAKVRSELAQIEEVHGNASGKLILGGNLNDIGVTVASSDVHLTARYGRLPQPLAITGGTFSCTATGIGIDQMSGRLGRSVFSKLSGALKWDQPAEIEITSGRFGLDPEEIVSWLASFDELRGLTTYYGGGNPSLSISALTLKGPLQSPRDWQFDLAGDVRDLVITNMAERASPISLAAAGFRADARSFTLTDGDLSLLDAAVKVSGTHSGYLRGRHDDIRLTLEGRLGPRFTQWWTRLLVWPVWLEPQPLDLLKSDLVYTSAEKRRLSASVATRDGLELAAKVLFDEGGLAVEKLSIQDQVSRATMRLQVKGRAVDLAFDGKIHQETVDKLFKEAALQVGSIEGNFQARLETDNLYGTILLGDLKGQAILLAHSPAGPLAIQSVALRGAAGKIRIDAADLNWGEVALKLSGSLQPEADRRLGLDLNITADAVDANRLRQLFSKEADSGAVPKGPTSERPLRVSGRIRFEADRLALGDLTWQPFHADVVLGEAKTDITLKNALLCGIAMPGKLTLAQETVGFDVSPSAKDQDLNATLNCLLATESAIDQFGVKIDKTIEADGTYSLAGRFQGNGKVAELLAATTGQMEFSATDGRIYQHVILLNVLKFLNATEILRGGKNMSQMKGPGFDYRSFTLTANLKDGKVMVSQGILDGPAMTLTAAGEHDLLTGGLDFDLLVTLQVALSRVLDKLPVVGGILQAFNTFPLSVEGTLDDIHIRPLSPSSVTRSLKASMEKTVEGPVNLIRIEKKPAAKSGVAP